MNFKLFLYSTGFLFLLGCNYNIQKQQSTPLPEMVFTTGRELSFAIVKEQVLNSQCLTCHSVGGSRGSDKGGVNLETYANFMANIQDVRNDILDGSMPMNSAPLSDYQKRLILAWIDSGAAELAQDNTQQNPAPLDPTPAPTPNPQPNPTPVPVVVPDIADDQIFFADVYKYVLATNCIKCHSPGGRHVDLTTYASVFENRADVASQLDMGEMPPSRGIPLTEAQLKLINTWLNKGAPEKAVVAEPPPTAPVVPAPQPTPAPTAPALTIPQFTAEQVSFGDIYKYVLETNCIKCHSPGGRHVDLTTYASVFENRADVADMIESGDMPPKKGTPLTDEQHKLINMWLEKGAPEKSAVPGPMMTTLDIQKIVGLTNK